MRRRRGHHRYRQLPTARSAAAGRPLHQGAAGRRRRAKELEEALVTLSTWDAGPDLVLFFKYLLVLNGEPEYELHFNETDALSASQRAFAEQALNRFRSWHQSWQAAA